jgi:magnesium transporter
MSIKGFEIDESGGLRPVDPHAAVDRSGKGDGPFWVDVQSGDSAYIEEVLKPFGLSPFMLHRCLQVGEATQIIPSPEAVYLEIAVYSDESRSVVINVAGLCLENLLITLHAAPIHTMEAVVRDGDKLDLKDRTISDLLITLLLLKTEEGAKSARVLRSSVAELDERLDHDPDSVELDEILDAKQAVSCLIAVSEEQEECFEVLAVAETDVLDFKKLQNPVKLLNSLSGSVNRRADRLASDVADLRQRYEMNQQDRTNHRLAILTVISAVFLPLTLIAGIWGMNFESMPELHLPYSYPGGLVLMALVAGLMTWGFYKRGWLG